MYDRLKETRFTMEINKLDDALLKRRTVVEGIKYQLIHILIYNEHC